MENGMEVLNLTIMLFSDTTSEYIPKGNKISS
jgi:hypothetical protein